MATHTPLRRAPKAGQLQRNQDLASTFKRLGAEGAAKGALLTLGVSPTEPSPLQCCAATERDAHHSRPCSCLPSGNK